MNYEQVLNNLIEHLIKENNEDMHTSLPCKITEIRGKEGYCDCEILLTREINEEVREFPPILNVKLDYSIFGSIKISRNRKVGDLVLVSFLEYSLDNVTNSEEKEQVDSTEKFSLDGAYITGSYKLDSEQFENYDENDSYLLEHKSGTTIKIKEDGNIEVVAETGTFTGDFKIDGNLEVTKTSKFTGAVNMADKLDVKGLANLETDANIKGISFLKHKHSNGNNGSPTGTPMA